VKQLGLKDYFGEALNVLDLFGNISAIIWLVEFKKLCTEDADKCKDIHTEYGGFYVYIQFLWTLSVTLRSSEIFKLRKTFR